MKHGAGANSKNIQRSTGFNQSVARGDHKPQNHVAYLYP